MTRPKTIHAADRITSMRHLIKRLSKGEMSRSAMMRYLGKCESVVRGYTNDMRDNGIIELSHRLRAKQVRNGEPVFRLIADAERIKQYLVDAANSDRRKKGLPTSAIAVASRDSSRHIHVMQDDEPYPVKVHRASVMPDPLALPRPFFRSVGAGVGAA